MINYLVRRPLAVFMAFLAFTLLGIVSFGNMPLSLMPKIDVPTLRIQISEPSYSSFELENLVTKPIREQLIQVSNLKNLKSEVINGKAVINLFFETGTDIDYTFIEVNNNIDKVMGMIPNDIDRPVVVKTSSLDIPLFYVQIPYPDNDTKVEFSSYVDNYVKKRLEQGKSISFIDISGLAFPKLIIKPDISIIDKVGLSIDDIGKAIKDNNANLGTFQINDGHYLLDVLFEPTLTDLESINNIFINTKYGSYQLKDLAEISLGTQKRKGFVYGETESISLAVFAKENIEVYEAKRELINNLNEFKDDNLNYSIKEDQTKLLEISINNLLYTILFGTILAVLVVFLFNRDLKLSIIIGIVIPVSLIISFLFLNLLNISINIISLSGLIISIGMMIDNSLIVVDNISQYKSKGFSFYASCTKGVEEIMKPLLSSLLTTCAVFIPLIYLSGISGVLFYDQAITITITLLISYLCSIILIPTLYAFLKINGKTKSLSKIGNIYHLSFNFLFERKYILLLLSVLIVISGAYAFLDIGKSKLPNIMYKDFEIYIDWNEQIDASENLRRVMLIDEEIESTSSKYIGSQDFLSSIKQNRTEKQAILFIETSSFEESLETQDELISFIGQNFPNALFTIKKPTNVFEKLFPDTDKKLIAKIPKNQEQIIDDLLIDLKNEFPETIFAVENPVIYKKIEIDLDKLALYKVDLNSLINKIQTTYSKNNEVSILKTTNNHIPIVIESDYYNFSYLDDIYIRNRESIDIPIKMLLEIRNYTQRDHLYADNNMQYIPVDIDSKRENEIISYLKRRLGSDIDFEGSFFEDQSFIYELFQILTIVVLLLYFVLAAQFESLLQPLIILSEIPLTLGLTILVLNILGISLNIMTMIGLIIILGIVINDSILKIDAINKSKQHMKLSLLSSIHEAGNKRLTAILMTTLTTILSMFPIFFTSGIGYDLQKPLAEVVIISMVFGTLISIYYVPIIYFLLVRNEE